MNWAAIYSQYDLHLIRLGMPWLIAAGMVWITGLGAAAALIDRAMNKKESTDAQDD